MFLILLEKARTEKPWELITEPTLFDKPIGLANRLILLNGLLIGLVLSALTIYLKDRIKDYVYSYKELTKDINIGFKLNIQTQKQEKFKETIKILSLKLVFFVTILFFSEYTDLGKSFIKNIIKSITCMPPPNVTEYFFSLPRQPCKILNKRP